MTACMKQNYCGYYFFTYCIVDTVIDIYMFYEFLNKNRQNDQLQQVRLITVCSVHNYVHFAI